MGECVGPTVGAGTGSAVGPGIGTRVGLAVGGREGAGLGSAVGRRDGAGLGCAVGGQSVEPLLPRNMSVVGTLEGMLQHRYRSKAYALRNMPCTVVTEARSHMLKS